MHAFCTKDCCSFVKDCKTEHRPFDIKRLGENYKGAGHFRLCLRFGHSPRALWLQTAHCAVCDASRTFEPHPATTRAIALDP